MKIVELNLREQSNARKYPSRNFKAAAFPELRDDPGARRVWLTATEWVPYEMVEYVRMGEQPFVTEQPPLSADEVMSAARHVCKEIGCGFIAAGGAGLAAHVRAKHGGG